MIYLSELIEVYKTQNLDYKLPIALGVGFNFKNYFADLTQLEHIITTGTTGSGKSVFANDVFVFLTSLFPPSKVSFLLFDFKQVEYYEYSSSPHLKSPVITGVSKAFDTLEKLIDEKNERLTSGRSIHEYPYIVAIIDTFSDWIYSDRTRFETLFTTFMSDAARARIHVVMCDSRMSLTTFTPQILSLFPTKIAFNTFDSRSSNDFFGYGGANVLVGKGDMLFSERNQPPIRLQAPMVTDNEVRESIRLTKAYQEASQ